MEGKDEIKDLFSNTLNNYELPVRADLWQGIASQMGTSTAVSTTSIWTKLAISTIGLATASMLVYAVFKSVDQQGPKTEKRPTEQAVKQNKNQDPSEKNVIGNHTPTQPIKPEIIPIESTSVPFIDLNLDLENLANVNRVQPFVTGPEHLFQVDLGENQSLNTTESTFSNVSSNEPNDIVVSDPLISQVQQPIPPPVEQSEKIGPLINVFTPNGDNVNDFLIVESSQLVDFQVVVLDRFNKTVFKSSDPGFRWDGTDLYGDPAPIGNYVYFITARDEDGKPINKYSTLRIER